MEILNEASIQDILLEESKTKGRDIKPIFIVTSWTNTPAGKVIRTYTRSIYTHAAISLDTSLEKLYTFNADNKLNKLGGFSIESIKDYISYYKNTRIKVNCFFVKLREFHIIQDALDKMIKNQKSTTYDYKNIFNVILNRVKTTSDDAMSMICSQFCEFIVHLADIQLVNKSDNLVTPKDLANISNPKIYNIFEGLAIDYNKTKIDRIFRKLRSKAEPIKEIAGTFTEAVMMELLSNFNEEST